jgi:hypothetical protein
MSEKMVLAVKDATRATRVEREDANMVEEVRYTLEAGGLESSGSEALPKN